ncbi:unnamed protein product [Fraxinus pennsylvanica]|uniref:Uncharacterized protein n=1 Tax=Fraxinus pennsylvanica TaxID=56036 RepID=A0AAD2E0J7_9LAMI|nr:unnamed protein product [Fraxinus pennsylvanica]
MSHQQPEALELLARLVEDANHGRVILAPVLMNIVIPITGNPSSLTSAIVPAKLTLQYTLALHLQQIINFHSLFSEHSPFNVTHHHCLLKAIPSLILSNFSMFKVLPYMAST